MVVMELMAGHEGDAAGHVRGAGAGDIRVSLCDGRLRAASIRPGRRFWVRAVTWRRTTLTGRANGLVIHYTKNDCVIDDGDVGADSLIQTDH